MHRLAAEWRRAILVCFCLLIPAMAPWEKGWTAAGPEDGGSYPAITGPCRLTFPQDHGEHPEHRTEWWYYTGNLTSEKGSRYAYQLTFFRSRMHPPGSEERWPSPASAWRTSQLYLAHTALTDIEGKRFYHAETLARGALGMAGVRRESSGTVVSVRNWSTRIESAGHSLTAVAGDFSFDLSLSPVKPPVLHGDDGYSLKGKSAERASCYYSLTRLQTHGTILLGESRIQVTGNSWMDHEFSSAPLEEDLVGWDWFSLQLSNGAEMMIYLMRAREGSSSPVSNATFVRPSGEVLHLTRNQIQIEVLDHWTSPHSGGRYPCRWGLRIPILGLELVITPNLADQELRTPESTRVTYWEGSVNAAGSMDQQPLSAKGYVELTGYAQPLDSRL
jgi:predicted secreted hydrolase